MCGIIAVFESQPASSRKTDELSAQIQYSLGYIAHRGPDASAVWVNEDASCSELYSTQPRIS
jgi:asparagine synthetase B (glutamine-hydrolysing)